MIVGGVGAVPGAAADAVEGGVQSAVLGVGKDALVGGLLGTVGGVVNQCKKYGR